MWPTVTFAAIPPDEPNEISDAARVLRQLLNPWPACGFESDRKCTNFVCDTASRLEAIGTIT